MLRFGSRNDVNTTFKCTVRLLEDTEVLELEFQVNYEGKDLLDQVCQQLNLVEKDYFGLRYVDLNKQRHWLDLNKTIVKQVKYLDPLLFSFRVKFYPPDPFRLKEEITRYQVYLQLRRDLLHGRLYCTPNEASLLAAYVVQADLGDFNPEEHEGNYVQDLRLLLKQTPQIEEKIIELHQTHLVGQSPQEVETNFLRRASSLDTYGVDPHPVKDHRGNQLYLGINHLGILTFQGSRKTNHFRWPEVHKINYEGKMFIVHLTYNEDPRTKKKQTVGFKCPTGAACRHVWRCAVEQMLFFTLPSGSVVPVVSGGSFFSWGTKFKYTGRTERELLEEVGPLRQEEPIINRLGSLRRKASSVPATPSSPTEMGDICYGLLPRSNHSVPDSRLDGGPSLLASNDEGSFCLDNIPLLETVSEDHEVHSRQRNAERDMDVMDGTAVGLSEYYLRESYDQSSSESQLLDGQGRSHRSSRSQTPVTRGKTGSRLSLNSGAVIPSQSATGEGTSLKQETPSHRIRLRASYLLPAVFFTAVLLVIFFALVLESSEDGLLAPLRRLPEVVAVRTLYYEPAKEFLRTRISAWVQ